MLKFDIAGHRKIWFLISALIIIPGLICMVRTSLAKYDLDDATIQLSGTQSDVKESENVMIRTRDLEEDQRKEVMATIKSDVGDYKVLREEKVGATIGGELITNAILALVVSWALIILYVAYRFELRFGIAAVLALIHDILIVLAVFSLTQRQIDSSFIAALLTIVGYSINDTIVIFDRIREYIALYPKRSLRSTRSSPSSSRRPPSISSAATRRRTSRLPCSSASPSAATRPSSSPARSGSSSATGARRKSISRNQKLLHNCIQALARDCCCGSLFFCI